MVSYAASAVSLTRDPELFRRLERVWGRGILEFSGIETHVTGAELIDPQRGYVIVSNHQSYMDIPILFRTLPIVPGFVAKQELAKVPFLAAALRLGGHVTIDRGNRQRAAASLGYAAVQVREGRTVLVFPEGTRSPSRTVGKFKLGAFHLAKAAGVPLVPVGVRGSGAVYPKHGTLIHPGRVEVHIGTPLAPDEVKATKARPLSERVRLEVARLADMPLREGFN